MHLKCWRKFGNHWLDQYNFRCLFTFLIEQQIFWNMYILFIFFIFCISKIHICWQCTSIFIRRLVCRFSGRVNITVLQTVTLVTVFKKKGKCLLNFLVIKTALIFSYLLYLELISNCFSHAVVTGIVLGVVLVVIVILTVM